MPGDGRYPTPRRGIDLDQPNISRVYDYYLGGTTNWAIDRYFGDEVLRESTLMSDIAHSNQVFMNRAIRYLMMSGVRQFIDVEPGALTRGNTHQMVDRLAEEAGRIPDARVVYTSSDPITVAYTEVALDRDGDPQRHTVVEADLCQPSDLWEQVVDTGILNLSQPVAVLLVTALHVQPPGTGDTDMGMETVAELRALLPAGSYLALAHLTADDASADICERLTAVKHLYDAWTSRSLVWRSQADIAQMLTGFELVEPGWTSTSSWHAEEGLPAQPDTAPLPGHALVWAGLGHKR